MDKPQHPLYSAEVTREKLINDVRKDMSGKKNRFPQLYWIITLALLIGIWQLAAVHIHFALLMPSPWSTFKALLQSVADPKILIALLITLKRVGIGFAVACLIGISLGYLMGYSKTILRFLDPLTNSVRLIPIMAWVPLTIVWFGLGDGPTIFLIAFAGLFSIMLSTISGVHDISADYYYAARSLGAGRLSIFTHVVIPGSLPSVLTGMRIGLGGGWMSVICAEFIATSSGFGHEMVYAETMLETNKLIALMILSGLVGFTIDRGMLLLSRKVIKWKNS